MLNRFFNIGFLSTFDVNQKRISMKISVLFYFLLFPVISYAQLSEELLIGDWVYSHAVEDSKNTDSLEPVTQFDLSITNNEEFLMTTTDYVISGYWSLDGKFLTLDAQRSDKDQSEGKIDVFQINALNESSLSFVVNRNAESLATIHLKRK